MELKSLGFLTIALFLARPSAFPQGSLTPPGAPSPTMKSLDQIEARTPISAVPITITNSGSYYLTTNVSVTAGDAISISSSGVTVELNGFTISSTASPTSGNGINIVGSVQDVTILNGHIEGGVTYTGNFSGPGFINGISGVNARNVRVSGVSVSGVSEVGIKLGFAATSVDHCVVRSCGTAGISSPNSVSDCSVRTCGGGISGDVVSNSVGSALIGGTGISGYKTINSIGLSEAGIGLSAAGSAINCRGESIGSGTGVGLDAFTAESCVGVATGGVGLNANTVSNSYARSTSGTALVSATAQNCTAFGGTAGALSAVTATNCYGSTTSGDGIHVTTAQNCQGYSANNYGIVAAIAHNCYGGSNTGVGLRYEKLGSNSYGYRNNPPSDNYVLGSGGVGPVDLP